MKDFAEAFVAAILIMGIVVWTAKVIVEMLWTP
jgi:hypothetical protein